MAYRSQPTITRPANTTAYSAGDVVGGAFQLVGLPEGGFRSLYLTQADVRPLIASIPSGMTSFRLHLYNQKPPSDIADNAAFDLTAADAAVYSTYIDLGSPADFGSTLFAKVIQVQEHIITGPTGVWAYLVTNGGFTPAANSEQYMVTVRAIDFN